MEEKIVFFCILGPVKERLVVALWKQQYVWIEMRIPPSHRGENLSLPLAVATTKHLHGTHWIHFNTKIRSFARLPALLNWQHHGASKWLEDCGQYSTHYAGKKNSASGYVLRNMARRPKFVCFKNKRELLEALGNLDNAIRA